MQESEIDVLQLPKVKEFIKETKVLIRRQNKEDVENILFSFIRQYGEDTIDIYRHNPFILVTEWGLPFSATRIKKGLFNMSTSLIPIPTFKMHLREIYAMIFDILRDNEGKGNSYMPFHLLYMFSKKFFPKITKDKLLSYLYFYKNEIDYHDGKVGFASRKMKEKYIYDKISPMLLDDISYFNYKDDPMLCSEQNEALKEVLKGSISILTGGPGTGKTTVIRTLLSEYKENFPDNTIRLLAPTGKAARRLGESIHGFGEALTIDSLIFSMKMHNVAYEGEVIDLMIIDEASMISTDCFYDLLIHTQIKKLILVGDTDQLPSVGCGNILFDLINLGVKTAYLTENHRCGDEIVENARKVKDGIPTLEFTSNFRFIELEDWKLSKFAAGLRTLDDTVILSPFVNMARNINIDVHKRLYPDDMETTYRVNDQVMFLKNHKQRGFMNGDMGKIVRFETDKVVISLFDRYNTEVSLSYEEIQEETAFGYAMTIHKSQGSEYDHVIIVLPKGSSLFFSKKLLYTAITRAKRKVTIIGSKEELYKLITSDNEEIRDTYLNDYLTKDTNYIMNNIDIINVA